MRLKVVISALCLIFITVLEVTNAAYTTCERNYKKIGCFAQSSSVLEQELVNDRDVKSKYFQNHMLNWKEFDKSLHSLACRCYEAAKKQGFTYFGIRFWGECHGGKNDKVLSKMIKTGYGKSNKCANVNFLTCTNHDDGTECAGQENAEYLYSIESDTDVDVDGGYGPWSPFSVCSLTCGQGVSVRERVCNNPMSQGNGKDCDVLGPSTEAKDCKIKACPIDGGYSDWSSFDDCSKTCGDGVSTRFRYCSNPKPQHGGKHCVGATMETKFCKNTECPVNGGFSDWSQLSSCSVTCGVGVQTQTRTCTTPAPSHGGSDCVGDDEKTTSCTEKPCPVDGGFTPWSSFSACSKICGDGEMERTRTCTNPAPSHGGADCVGATINKQSCKLKECPVDGKWSSWSSYSSCSVTCGLGIQKRTHTCSNPKPQHGGDDCVGDDEEIKQCKVKDCPIDGYYSSWSLFSDCTQTCGDGEQTRTRTCTNPAPKYGGKDCTRLGTAKETVPCKNMECPIDGGLTSWGDFSTCSQSCGVGLQERKRSCTNPKPQHNGQQCAGETVEERECKIKECPVDGAFTSWGAFGACSTTCGQGVEQRKRSCTNPSPAHGGKECTGLTIDQRACKVKDCPVNGGFTSWSSYGSCSEKCGDGHQKRTRSCTNPTPAHGGDICVGQDEETKQCKIKECPVDGGFSEWSDFGACSETCGDGQRMRKRSCSNPSPAHGGKQCMGALQETKSCKEKECPVDGGLSAWSNFGMCSETCGNGLQERTRSCTNPAPAHGGDECLGDLSETKACKTKECPVNGGYTEWSPFGGCSKICGDGVKKRTRTCTNPKPAHGGKGCHGDSENTEWCKVKECPVDGGFTQWSTYNDCSKTCGIGAQSRTRTCTNPSPKHGGKSCVGPTVQSLTCNLRECPVDGRFTSWSSYGDCSELCGVGEQERTRSCTNPAPAHGGRVCVGSISETRACKIRQCKVDGGYSTWSNFDSCSKTCGKGSQSRTRKCINSRLDCSGPAKNTRLCKVKECPVNGGLTSWTPYSACSKSCGAGTQSRTRSCSNPTPAHGGKRCYGDLKESRSCKESECPVHGGFTKWSSFTHCSETCGIGSQQRTRSCTNPAPAHGGRTCSGSTVHTRVCRVKICPINGGLTQWTSYSRCSKLCGVGFQERKRSCVNPRPAHGGKPCVGAVRETRGCKVKDCPVNGIWGAWGAYDDCSVTCGGGIKQKTRVCNNPAPAHGGRSCYGSNKYTSRCNTRYCPVNGGFTSWSTYGVCSKSCGLGSQVRTRSCTNPKPAHGGVPCSGAIKESRTCKRKDCPVNGNWGGWGSFGSCSVTCGKGVQEKYRGCNNPAPAHGGKTCAGFNRYVKVCNTNICPVNGNWSPWSPFGKCTKHCGLGAQQKMRFCSNPPPSHGGKTCTGSMVKTRTCKLKDCAVDGQWGPWSGYGKCTKYCGNGEQQRMRFCINPPPSLGGKDCPGPMVNTRTCKVKECPVNGGFTSWSSYGACSKTCGIGSQVRKRSCTNPRPAYGGRICYGPVTNSRSCKVKECAVHGGWSSWGNYGSCSAHCNGGVKARFRYCNSPVPSHGGNTCSGSNKMVSVCNTHKCPVNGNWGNWGSYGACSVSCNGGVKKRYRYCNKPSPAHGGGNCAGSNTMVHYCNTHKCPVNGNWGTWSGYSSCSAKCGGGVRTRNRYCNKPAPANGGKACAGGSSMVTVCNTQKCTGWSGWGNWGLCTLPCGGGIRFRFRNCPTWPCPGSQNMVGVCNLHSCAGK